MDVSVRTSWSPHNTRATYLHSVVGAALGQQHRRQGSVRQCMIALEAKGKLNASASARQVGIPEQAMLARCTLLCSHAGVCECMPHSAQRTVCNPLTSSGVSRHSITNP